MSEYQTFFFESYKARNSYYDIDEKGIIYRPGDSESFSFFWNDIKYIEDRPGGQVIIVLANEKEVPINYYTNEFPVLLKLICLRLSEIRQHDFRAQKFPLETKYSFHLLIVVCLLVLSMIISLAVSKLLFLMFFSLCFPLALFFQRQPISLTVDNHGLTFHYLFKETMLNYDEIVNMNFEIKMNDYGNTLCIVLQSKSNNSFVFKKFQDLIILFIMLQIKLNENCTDESSPRLPHENPLP